VVRFDLRIANADLLTSSTLLSGHQSIVNTTLMHPHFPHIVTSGIERHILLHSPSQSSPCSQNLKLTPEVRNLPVLSDRERMELRRNFFVGPDFDDEDGATDDDLHVTARFDACVCVSWMVARIEHNLSQYTSIRGARRPVPGSPILRRLF
jgi:WD repeat-containing protein 22